MTSDLVTINQRYKSSTRIDSSSEDYKGFIDSFILHGTAVNVLHTLARDQIGNDQRVYTITGPYGSGKSTVALYLGYLLSEHKRDREYALQKLSKIEELKKDFIGSFKINHGWKIIKHVSGLESPANALLLTIRKAKGLPSNEQDVADYDDTKCLEEISSLLNQKDSKTDGYLILIDEMGKALDYQARNNKDLHLFQSLADIAQQAQNRVIVLGFLHQAFSDYAKNKDAKTQQEWAKVQGRYKDLGFNPSIDECLVLTADSISKTDDIKNNLELKYKAHIDTILKHFDSQSRNREALLQTLPLDPLVSLLLGPISRRRFSQNERSLFGFLASHEKLGFREFLSATYSSDSNELKLYSPERLWDYLHHNLHHQIVSSQDSKAWLEACDAIYRAGQKGNELHISITKVIALLTLFGFHYHLHSKREFIEEYFSNRGFDENEVKQAIKELETWTVVIYRQKHAALFVFQGSDIDINDMLIKTIETISEGYDWTSVCDISESILATAHYHKTGTMRWANTRLIANRDGLPQQNAKPPVTGQAFLSFLLPTEESLSKGLKKTLSESPYFVVGTNNSLDSLKSAAIELLALQHIFKNEKAIAHDLIAKKELENRTKSAKQNLEVELSLAFMNATWSHQGESYSNQPLSSIASNIADKVFHKSPVIINELVNRSKPSGSANSAIRKLLMAMLEHGDEEDLNIQSSATSMPPEKGLYLSCLASKGWHCKTDEGYVFPSKWPDEKIAENTAMHTLWLDGVNFIKNSDRMVTMEELYDFWMAPPYGLTAGLCRIYGLALLKSLEGQVAFYDLDSTKQFIFIPELDEVLVTKVFKHPAEAGVRYFEMSEIQTHLLSKLAQATTGERSSNDILAIAKHIVKIVHTLPTWVKKTSGDSFGSNGLTQEAKDFRNRVLAANDPYKLILEDLPNIFNLKKDEADLDNKLSHCLKTAVEDLSAQHDMLINGFKNILLEGLGAEAIDERLMQRCEVVASIAQRPNVKEFATRLLSFINSNSTFEDIISLAAGVPQRNWTDKHLRNGLDELQTLCTQFRRIESFSSLGHVKDSKPLSFVTADKSGKHYEYSSYVKYGLEEDMEVIDAIDSVRSSVKELSKEKQIAALTNLIVNLMDEED